MANEKGKFTDLGMVSCWDTNAKGAKRRTKSGNEFSAGTGTITLHGIIYRVYVSVHKGRPGQTTVGLALIEDETATAPPVTAQQLNTKK